MVNRGDIVVVVEGDKEGLHGIVKDTYFDNSGTLMILGEWLTEFDCEFRVASSLVRPERDAALLQNLIGTNPRVLPRFLRALGEPFERTLQRVSHLLVQACGDVSPECRDSWMVFAEAAVSGSVQRIWERGDVTDVMELMGDDSDFSPDDEGGDEDGYEEESEDTDGSQ